MRREVNEDAAGSDQGASRLSYQLWRMDLIVEPRAAPLSCQLLDLRSRPFRLSVARPESYASSRELHSVVLRYRCT